MSKKAQWSPFKLRFKLQKKSEINIPFSISIQNSKKNNKNISSPFMSKKLSGVSLNQDFNYRKTTEIKYKR
jgi:hypothetical protein